jgi:hypothetical protein
MFFLGHGGIEFLNLSFGDRFVAFFVGLIEFDHICSHVHSNVESLISLFLFSPTNGAWS